MIKSLLKPGPVTLALFLVIAVSAVLTHDPGSRVSIALALLAVLIPGGLLVLFVHELGHVLGGLLSGYRFVALVCGPLSVARVNGRLEPGWNPLWSLYGGIAVLAPRGGRLPSTRETAALFAAGPLASVLFGLLFAALHFGLGLDDVKRSTVAEGTHTIWQLLFGACTRIVALCSLAGAVATMIPNAIGGFTSDGAAIRMLLKGGPDAARLQAMNAIMGQLTEGARPRDWTPEFVQRAASVQDGSALESSAASLALQHALDRGDLRAARGHLARMLAAREKAPAFSEGELLLYEAWLAIADGRTAEARTVLAQSAEGLMEEYSRLRVLAAILVAEGKPDEGRAAAREGLALLQQEDHHFAGLAALEREWLEQLAEGRLPAVLRQPGVPA